MSKYQLLATHLHQSGQNSIAMTFAKIERIVGTKLPPSAFKYRAWWSNNPMNSVITRAWLDAGYKTENVDMSKRKLIFKKVLLDTSTEKLPFRKGRVTETANVRSFSFSRIFGALKGTVTIMPGVDLTRSTGETWDAEK